MIALILQILFGNYFRIESITNIFLIDTDESKATIDDQFYSHPEETLKNRNKGQHLDFAEKLKLYNMHSLSKLKIDDILQNCFVNSSTMHIIIKDFES